MESIGCDFTTTLTLPNTMPQHRHYPAHDAHLAEYSAMLNQRPATKNSVEEYHNPHYLPVECKVEISEIFPESKPVVGEGDQQVIPEIIYPAEFESPDSQIEVELKTTDDQESDTSIQTTDGRHTTRPHPKKSKYLLGVYLAFLGLVWWKLERESDTHFPTVSWLFIIVSVVIYAIAVIDLYISSWIHDCLHNQNSSRQDLFLGCYTILRDVYYGLCILAFLLLLAAFLVHQPPSISPPPPPPHHPYHHRH